MKKTLALLTISIFALGTSVFAAHSMQTTFNYNTTASAQFIELDEASGNLWVAVGGVGNPDMAFVYSTTGVEAAFSPLTAGLSSAGVYTSFRQTSGVGIDKSVTPHVAYVVTDMNNTDIGHYISKFNTQTGAAINGLDSTSGNWLNTTAQFNRIGDVAFDAAGHLFMVAKVAATGGPTCFVLDKTTGAVLNQATAIFTGGGAIKRGMGVSSDGNTVYLADESLDVVWKLTGDSSLLSGSTAISYSGATLATYVTADNPSACEVDSNGNVYVSVSGANKVDIYNAAGTLVETLAPTSPMWDGGTFTPRGVAFNSGDLNTNTLWVARFATIAEATGSGPIAVFTPPAAIDSWAGYSL
jgi:hypothetical protein